MFRAHASHVSGSTVTDQVIAEVAASSDYLYSLGKLMRSKLLLQTI